MDDDVAGELVHDQQGHVIGNEIVGGKAVDTALGIGDARPHGEINDGRDQPVEQVHDQIGAVLPLFRPVDLPESLEDFEHNYLFSR